MGDREPLALADRGAPHPVALLGERDELDLPAGTTERLDQPLRVPEMNVLVGGAVDEEQVTAHLGNVGSADDSRYPSGLSPGSPR